MATRNEFLPFATVEQADRESGALRRVAAMLGKEWQWDDTAGMVEHIATLISQAGLPHPGLSENNDAYLELSNALWEAEHPEAVR